jgi:hypothetical protein
MMEKKGIRYEPNLKIVREICHFMVDFAIGVGNAKLEVDSL